MRQSMFDCTGHDGLGVLRHQQKRAFLLQSGLQYCQLVSCSYLLSRPFHFPYIRIALCVHSAEGPRNATQPASSCPVKLSMRHPLGVHRALPLVIYQEAPTVIIMGTVYAHCRLMRAANGHVIAQHKPLRLPTSCLAAAQAPSWREVLQQPAWAS